MNAMNYLSNNNLLLFPILFFLFFITALSAQTNPNHVKVKGYYRSNGTYVKSHYRTAPNATNRDNFSTRGNTNDYTGKAGWVTPDNKANTTYNRSTQNNSDYQSNTTYNNTRYQSNTTYNTTNYESRTTYNTYSNERTTLEQPSSTYSSTALKQINYNNGYADKDRRILEQILERLGYNPGVVDGQITRQTIAAIERFQQAHDLSVDGKFGPKCIEVLNQYAN